jgi:hypothetical protein
LLSSRSRMLFELDWRRWHLPEVENANV